MCGFLAFGLLATGCGQKGPLVLPPPQPGSAVQPAAPAASATGAAAAPAR